LSTDYTDKMPCVNSTFPSLFCFSTSTLFSSMARTSFPAASYSLTGVGVFYVEYLFAKPGAPSALKPTPVVVSFF
jgi:hypothetical protein